ncbi:hypothetical protein SO802_013425 [Lithocarpus litseifolius]|uniref:Uncharacterized protein n=1 Tax=Lithocarpus litseifolius TaxID=425828 RepID=A0AAW2D6F6_9ROSI
MWMDCIKLKRLKERPKISAQQAAEKQKPKQTTEIRLRGSRAQDGILKLAHPGEPLMMNKVAALVKFIENINDWHTLEDHCD